MTTSTIDVVAYPTHIHAINVEPEPNFGISPDRPRRVTIISTDAVEHQHINICIPTCICADCPCICETSITDDEMPHICNTRLGVIIASIIVLLISTVVYISTL